MKVLNWLSVILFQKEKESFRRTAFELRSETLCTSVLPICQGGQPIYRAEDLGSNPGKDKNSLFEIIRILKSPGVFLQESHYCM